MRSQSAQIPIDSKDKEFFLTFYSEYKHYMYYIAQKYTPEQADCEDLVQDSTLRLMSRIPILKQLTPAKKAKYIALTIRSAYIDSDRRRKKDNLLLLDDEMLEALMLEQLLQIDRQEAESAVAQLRKELPARDWMVLEAKYLLELSQEEIARMIGVASDSVRMILHRAKERARNLLNDRGGEFHG